MIQERRLDQETAGFEPQRRLTAWVVLSHLLEESGTRLRLYRAYELRASASVVAGMHLPLMPGDIVFIDDDGWMSYFDFDRFEAVSVQVRLVTGAARRTRERQTIFGRLRGYIRGS